MWRHAWLPFLLLGCGEAAAPPPARPVVIAAPPAAAEPPHAPACSLTITETELRVRDGARVLDDLAARIRLGPADEALRHPRSLDDVRKILRRDVIYLFPAAAAFARTQTTREGRIAEAQMELLMGESQLVASQVLSVQEAWVSADLRIARATLATESGPPSNDRTRLLAQLVKVVDDGNAIAAALGATAPAHVARGAEVVRGLRAEAPDDPAVAALLAEYHRLRGEWPEFDQAMASAESGADAARGGGAGAGAKERPALRYLRAMEQVERHHRPLEGAQLMRDALKAQPRFVRAQAALVMMAPNPRVALQELRRLRAMNEDHYLVMLLEPTLAADQELDRIENATGQSGGTDDRPAR